MPTNYNVSMMAVHPLSMTFNPPSGEATIEAVRDLLESMGMTPVSASVGRADNATTFTQYEGKAWVHNAPDDLILAVAKMLDGFVAQLVDPESPLMAPDGGGPWDEPSSVYAAEAFLKYRKEVTST